MSHKTLHGHNVDVYDIVSVKCDLDVTSQVLNKKRQSLDRSAPLGSENLERR